MSTLPPCPHDQEPEPKVGNTVNDLWANELKRILNKKRMSDDDAEEQATNKADGKAQEAINEVMHALVTNQQLY